MGAYSRYARLSLPAGFLHFPVSVFSPVGVPTNRNNVFTNRNADRKILSKPVHVMCNYAKLIFAGFIIVCRGKPIHNRIVA